MITYLKFVCALLINNDCVGPEPDDGEVAEFCAVVEEEGAVGTLELEFVWFGTVRISRCILFRASCRISASAFYFVHSAINHMFCFCWIMAGNTACARRDEELHDATKSYTTRRRATRRFQKLHDASKSYTTRRNRSKCYTTSQPSKTLRRTSKNDDTAFDMTKWTFVHKLTPYNSLS